RSEHGARRRDLGGEKIVPRLDLGARQPFAGEIAEAGNRRAADGAPAHLDQAAAGGLDNLLKMLTPFLQVGKEAGKAQGRGRLQPRIESEEGGAVGGSTGGGRKRASDQRRLARRAPRDETLVFLIDERGGAIGDR